MIKFPNNKMYIGKTIYNLNIRKNQHRNDMKRDRGNKAVYNAIKKYGWDNLNWNIIDTAENEEELMKKEIYWIKYHNTHIHAENSMGYNMTFGGDGISGYKFSDKQKQKLSKLRIGKYKGENNPNYNNKWNDEQKQYISNLNKDRLKGENNPAIIITEDIAKEIKIKLSKGESMTLISKELDVSYDIVRNIKQLKCWHDLLPELNDEFEKFKQKRTKLPIEKAKEIKIRLSNGEHPNTIMEELDVTKDNVFNIKYLKNYKDLFPELNDKIYQ